MSLPEEEEQQPAAKSPALELPDYLTDPDATMKDVNATWRYGKPPDYSNTRKVWAQTKQMNHTAGSLPQLVENLVKNWEVEASFKPVLSDWRTIDHENYTFAINGGPPQSAEHMLKVGTYNAIIAPNQYYCPAHSDFHSSHKSFKRMMPTFAWEVLEVYSGPPKVAFRWRHWGVMKNDYVGFNDQGEKVTAKAHGGPIDIQGVTVADVDKKVRFQSVMTWFDPMEMFRQIAPQGVVNKQAVPHRAGQTFEDLLDQPVEGDRPAAPDPPADISNADRGQCPAHVDRATVSQSMICPILHTLDKAKQQLQELQASISIPKQAAPPTPTTSEHGSAGPVDGHENFDSRAGTDTGALPPETLETDTAPTSFVEVPYPHPHTVEEQVQPSAGEAVVAPETSKETEATKAEMGQATDDEQKKLLNVE